MDADKRVAENNDVIVGDTSRNNTHTTCKADCCNDIDDDSDQWVWLQSAGKGECIE